MFSIFTSIMWKICSVIGVPPSLWMIPNPFKIYEFKRIMEEAAVKPEHHILDVGCGKGHWTILITKKCGFSTGVDTSKTQIQFAQKFVRHSSLKNKIRFVCGRLQDAGLKKESFDRIFSFSVMEHIPELESVLRICFDALKPNGELHISVDALSSIKDLALIAKHKKDHFVHQYFTPDSLRALLENAGFKVRKIEPIMKGDYARSEFEKRISKSFKKNIFEKYFAVNRLHVDDLRLPETSGGIMLIASASKPASNEQ